MTEKKEILIKVVLVGDSGVGKSSIMKRYVQADYKEDYLSTIGVDFEILDKEINEFHAHVQIWDTAGQERFRTITANHYKGANIIIIVYDITEKSSFENVQTWVKEITRYTERENYELLLIGNKSDLESSRTVTLHEAEQLKNELNCNLVETSAKKNVNVDAAFDNTLKKFVRERGRSLIRQKEAGLSIKKLEEESCCWL